MDWRSEEEAREKVSHCAGMRYGWWSGVPVSPVCASSVVCVVHWVHSVSHFSCVPRHIVTPPGSGGMHT